MPLWPQEGPRWRRALKPPVRPASGFSAGLNRQFSGWWFGTIDNWLIVVNDG